MKLLTPAYANPKTRKTDAARYLGAIMHLAPSDDGAPEGKTVCPDAVRAGCRIACLAFQGRARVFETIRAARRVKTALYFADRSGFMAKLRAELGALERAAARARLKPVVRLDGTSDLGIAMHLHGEFGATQFYDYTKVAPRVERWARMLYRGEAQNYHLTYSAGAHNSESELRAFLERGINVAVAFDLKNGAPLPYEYLGAPVLDGDLADDRFNDPPGHVVGLRAKGNSAQLGETGFIRSASKEE